MDIKNIGWKVWTCLARTDQSYFITGPGGSGKTSLLKLIQTELTKQDKKSWRKIRWLKSLILDNCIKCP